MKLVTNDIFTGHFTVKHVNDRGFAFLAAPAAAKMDDVFVPAKIVDASGIAEGDKVVADYVAATNPKTGEPGFQVILIGGDEALLAQLRTQRNRPVQAGGIGGKTPPNARQANAARKKQMAEAERQRRLALKGGGGNSKGKKAA